MGGTIEYSISITRGTNTNQPNGGTLTATISRLDEVPTGAYVTSATLYIERMQCYTSKNARLRIGDYGTTSSFSSDSATHSDTVSASISDAILGVDSETITLTV